MLQLPKVIGHRGAAAYAPENTLASFREARRRGAAWVEIDVKLTADGVPVLMHDDSLKRTTGVDRLVARDAARRAAGGGADLRGGDRLLRRAGAGLQRRDQALPGREAETARAAVETLRRCWPASLPTPLLSSFKDASLAAAQCGAGPAAGAADRRPSDGWQARARGGGGGGINTNGKRLTAPRAVAAQAGRLRPRRLHHRRPGGGPGPGRHGGRLRHHRRARHHPGCPRADASNGACLLYTGLVDCHETVTK